MFNKISFKMTAGLMTILSISMLVTGIFFIQMFRQYIFSNTEETLFKRATSIAQVVSDYTENKGFMPGTGGFMKFLDIMSESKVWIIDKEGKPIVISGKGMGLGMSSGMSSAIEQQHTLDSGPLPLDSNKVIIEVLANNKSITNGYSSVLNELVITVGVPVFDSNKNIFGIVILQAPVTGITATLDKSISILIISIIVALILSGALGVIYSMLFTRPLKAMNKISNEMTNGNYSVRTGIKRKDEIGQLGTSLDLLASKLGVTIDQLFQEKGKIEDIITSISEGIVAFDLDLTPVNYNSAISEIMNNQQTYTNHLLLNDFKKLKIQEALKTVINEKESLKLMKIWNGKQLKFTLSPIVDNKSNVTGCVALVQDISESEQLEQLRKDFVANVSHEFRTPLTVIKASLEALTDGTITQTDEINLYHNKMISETRILERLVGDLMDLSRLQSGKISINKENIHIPSVLSDSIRNLQMIANKKNIKINFKTSPEQNVPPVIGDYDRIRQLFVIIIDNAIKYSPNNSEITISISISDTFNISIKDQGYGIPDNELPYVWDRFYKSDKSRKGNGTGLGLAIAKHLVELHNGKISIQSKVNEGSTVNISLPYQT